MRSAAIGVVIACLTGACGPQHAPVTMKWSERVLVGSLFGVLATSLGAAASKGSTKDAFVAADVSFGALGLGSVVVYLFADASDTGRPMTEREIRQDQAWQLTKRARTLARQGKCDRVREIEPRVEQLDPSFHDVVFVRDVAIARCLGH